MIIKILFTIFVAFTLSRAVFRKKDKSITNTEFFVWLIIWIALLFFTWWPNFSDLLANIVGVGRGVDVLLYFAVVLLFYGMFRIYVKLEFIEREITDVIRKVSLDKADKRKKNTEE